MWYSMWVRQRWEFWKVFPNNVVGILSVGLVTAGVMMLLQPRSYRAFYLDTIGDITLTPTMAGVGSLVAASLCLISRAQPWTVALIASTFMGRAVMLFTAWASDRISPPPPPTRWIWEVINVIIILLAAAHFRRNME